MKYMMTQDKKGKLVISKFERIDRKFKKIHKMDKCAFLNKARKKVNTLSLVSNFDFKYGSLYVTWLDYSSDEIIREAEIVLNPSLNADKNFIDELTDIARFFDENKTEARNNFRNLYHSLEDKKEVQKRYKDLLVQYAKNSDIGELSQEDRKKMIDILKGGKRNLLKGLFIPFKFKWQSHLYKALGKSLIACILLFIGSILGGFLFTVESISIAGCITFAATYSISEIMRFIKKRNQDCLCRELLKDLVSSQDSKDTQEDEEQIKVNTKEDELFLCLVKDAGELMKTSPNYDSKEVFTKLQKLVSDYKSIAAGNLPYDYLQGGVLLLRRLCAIELEVYSKEKRIGLKNCLEVATFSATFLDRLRFLGYNIGYMYKDEFLKPIKSIIDRISSNPYYGCEMELLKLTNLACDYVAKLLYWGNAELFFQSADYNTLLDEKKVILEEALDKLEKSKKYSELNFIRNNLLDSINGELSKTYDELQTDIGIALN